MRIEGNPGDERRHKVLEWDPATDRIVSASTWGNFGRKSLGRVELITASGGRLSVGKDVSNQNEYKHDVGAGVLLGAFGRQGWQIDQLGFNFLRGKKANMKISDVKYEKSPEQLNKDRA